MMKKNARNKLVCLALAWHCFWLRFGRLASWGALPWRGKTPLQTVRGERLVLSPCAVGGRVGGALRHQRHHL